MEAFTDTYGHYVLRLLVATFVGGLIGVEREYKGKPAGMRTNMLMCMGSCLVMILSIETAKEAGPPADPGRIAAQVVTGVGFLGAGTILRSRVSVTGLTSAATIWFVAALGLTIGAGLFTVTAAATAFMILTLTVLAGVEHRLSTRRQLHVLRLRVRGKDLAAVRGMLTRNRITPDDLEITREADAVLMDIEYIAVERKYLHLVASLEKLDEVDVLLHY
jgi:putative Mg2+ transporter-C (MgtC) family protein